MNGCASQRGQNQEFEFQCSLHLTIPLQSVLQLPHNAAESKQCGVFGSHAAAPDTLKFSIHMIMLMMYVHRWITSRLML